MGEFPSKLPPEAYRELKEGEVYNPIVPGTVSPPEITARSVGVGVVMAIIFSASSGVCIKQALMTEKAGRRN